MLDQFHWELDKIDLWAHTRHFYRFISSVGTVAGTVPLSHLLTYRFLLYLPLFFFVCLLDILTETFSKFSWGKGYFFSLLLCTVTWIFVGGPESHSLERWYHMTTTFQYKSCNLGRPWAKRRYIRCYILSSWFLGKLAPEADCRPCTQHPL